MLTPLSTVIPNIYSSFQSARNPHASSKSDRSLGEAHNTDPPYSFANLSHIYTIYRKRHNPTTASTTVENVTNDHRAKAVKACVLNRGGAESRIDDGRTS